MLPLFMCGLLAVGSVFSQDKIDYSGMTTRVQIDNQVKWWPPPIIGGGIIGGIGGITQTDPDSSEHGVGPGPRSTNCLCGGRNKGAGRIIGGKVYGPNEYPFIAGVAHGHTPNRPHCGSAIISPWHILTAAHCTAGAKSLVVILGEYDRSGRSSKVETKKVKRIIDHERYHPQLLRHDISLLFLEEPIKQNAIIGLVCLPTGPTNIINHLVKILGWGAMRFQGPMTTLPQKVNVRVVDMQTCNRAWPYHVLVSPATQVCTHSIRKTACQGDSGGPVVWLDPETNRFTLVGLVSFGPNCEDDKPSIQTSVAAYLPWIKAKIQETTPGQMTCNKV
uniref:Venom S1 protease 2 n=1 Tax=Platymeris rhadamanthus TaxID=1134088 RepID=A0A6B9L3X1_PLARH|nr:venom S1 protease 2 [Platymeris rhadamanthus]